MQATRTQIINKSTRFKDIPLDTLSKPKYIKNSNSHARAHSAHGPGRSSSLRSSLQDSFRWAKPP